MSTESPTPQSWTIGRVVSWAADDFRTRGIESPRLEAELLLGFALGLDRIRVIVDRDRPLAPDELARFREVVRRRRAREPLAYIRGEREFFGRPFRVDQRVLVPRPDTETLVETALARSRDRSMWGRALDLCTGSGCVAVSFARERPTWRVDAVDLSGDALAVARDNASRLGAVFGVRFVEGDLFAPLSPGRDAYDVVTANPPYVVDAEIAGLAPEIRSFEPRLALAGGADGLDVVRRIVAEAPRWLVDGGVLALEIGAGQADEVERIFVESGFVDVLRARDYGGIDRVVSGVVARGVSRDED